MARPKSLFTIERMDKHLWYVMENNEISGKFPTRDLAAAYASEMNIIRRQQIARKKWKVKDL